MSSNKPGTPVTSPKMPKSVKLDVPSTPPAAKPKKRLLAFLQTPEQQESNLPFSPGLKRTNSGNLISPDYKLNSHNILSPYSSASLLKTPKNGGYDSDERDTPKKSKRTPQFFSPGKRLFTDDHSPNKEDLAEISSQLKNRLSSALDKIKGNHDKNHISPVKLDFSDQSFTSTKDVPFKPIKPSSPPQQHPAAANSTTSTPIQPGRESAVLSPLSLNLRANLNLQTLQQSPAPFRRSRNDLSHGHSETWHNPHMSEGNRLSEYQDRISVPSPDDESSAHQALLAAFSRLRHRRHSSTGERRRSFVLALNELPSYQHAALPGSNGTTNGTRRQFKLPPINVSGLDKKPSADSEQDAVLSLMSLSSPQKMAAGLGHSKQSSQNDSSLLSSTSLPKGSTVLPPISGLIRNVDNDETDVEDTTSDEEE